MMGIRILIADFESFTTLFKTIFQKMAVFICTGFFTVRNTPTTDNLYVAIISYLIINSSEIVLT